MTTHEMFMTIFLIMLGTMITRFLIFLIFPSTRSVPHFILYLGAVLPSATIGLLVVYALKDTTIYSWPYGLPEIIAILFLICIHKWRRSTLLSIGGSTIFYMFLVQYIF